MGIDPLLPFRCSVLKRLQSIGPGQNLYDLAYQFGVTVCKDNHVNKGWVGQTLEWAAGLKGSNQPKRDGADFELKSTSLVFQNQRWHPKETIRITQLNPKSILEEEFESSTLWNKLSRWILVGCFHQSDTQCFIVRVIPFDLKDESVVQPIKAFWNDIRSLLAEGEIANFTYHGNSEEYIQLRPTGTGKHSTRCPITGRKFPAQAFYATKRLLHHVLTRS